MRGLEEIDLRQLREKLNELAVAHEEPVCRVERDALGQLVPKEIEDAKAIVGMKGEVPVSVKVASKDYLIIQHKEAFTAVLDALVSIQGERKVRASVLEYKGRAWLTVTFPEMKVNDGEDGIELGFKVTNSIDKTSALRYSSNTKHTESTGGAGNSILFKGEESHFDFFGYRLSCMNGMTMRVPIDWSTDPKIVSKDQAKVGDLVDARIEKVVDKAEELVVVPAQMQVSNSQGPVAKTSIRHYGKQAKVDFEKLKLVLAKMHEYIPILEERIRESKRMPVSVEEAKKLLEDNGFGPRITEDVLKQYGLEEQNRWGLYNAITYVATHDERRSVANMENVLKRAEVMMVKVGA